ncbi:MAG: hypothetical protein IV093_22665 [Rubrivivax sp.]|nr:hypothetical protein [Rubrivivax sp.]
MNSPLPTRPDGQHHLLDDGIGPALDTLGHGARDMALDGAHAVRNAALRARDSTSHYIQEKPVTAVLLAAGAGMALMLVAGLLMRGSSRSR